MRGSLKQRYKGSWSLILDLGYETDSQTGLKKRRQKWVTFKGTKKEAQTHLTELLRAANRGEFVEPTKATFGEWLTKWLHENVRLSRRPGTHVAYSATVKLHIAPALGNVPLQSLRPGHLTAYYLERGEKLSRKTLDLHHAIISSSLKSALKQGLVTRNVAALAEGRPAEKDRREEAKRHCWTPEEAQRFLVAADTLGPQLAALCALAVDSGARKGELLGLLWADVNFEAGTVTIDRTLLRSGREPEFGPTKTGNARTVDLNAETVRRLAEHKRTQAELKMRNRTAYNDLGLVFAKEWGDLHGREDSLGLPLGINNLGSREFARVIKAADVRRIKFHGLRHTCATLLLAAGVPPHVVAARLGHAKVTTTLETYAHALPAHGQEAARLLGAVLYGRVSSI